MSEETNAAIARHTVAVATRLQFYRGLESRLDDWVMDNPAQLNTYQARMEQIAVAKMKWEAELDAIATDINVITAPTAEEVDALKESVKKLSEKVAASNAADDFLNLITEAAEMFD